MLEENGVSYWSDSEGQDSCRPHWRAMMASAVLSGIAMIASLVGVASAQKPESFESIVISCASAPSDAKTQLPPKLAEWATLSCTKFGHVLRAAKGWIWHNPRDNSFVRIWSQTSAGELAASGHKSYFRALEFRHLAGQEADAANALLATELGAQPQTVEDAYALSVTDAQGRVQLINFIRSSANVRLGTFWGWACESPCSKPVIFMGFRP